MNFKDQDEALTFAIAREVEAQEFYLELADRFLAQAMEGVFREFAAEELGHKIRLENIRSGRKAPPGGTSVTDLKIGDYLVEVEVKGEMTYQQALILAMKREKAAFRLYSDLAARAGDQGLKDTFVMLAREEARHKLRFEIEYDEHILKEN